MDENGVQLETYRWADEVTRIANRAAHRVQEENRRRGIPNVYSINGIIYYELPNGELSREDPYVEPPAAGESNNGASDVRS